MSPRARVAFADSFIGGFCCRELNAVFCSSWTKLLPYLETGDTSIFGVLVRSHSLSALYWFFADLADVVVQSLVSLCRQAMPAPDFVRSVRQWSGVAFLKDFFASLVQALGVDVSKQLSGELLQLSVLAAFCKSDGGS